MKLYRSGSGRSLRRIHGHIDPMGPASKLLPTNTVSERYGYATKSMLVNSLALTDEALADHNHHPPNRPGDCISTTVLEPWNPNRIQSWLDDCAQTSHLDVEVEQVIAAVSGSSELIWVPKKERVSLATDQLGSHIHLVEHLDTEFHLRVNVPKTDIRFPDPATLLAETRARGMTMRSWYRFDRGDSWGYNSNEFFNEQGVGEQMLHNHGLMVQYLEHYSFRYELYTFLESVLVICHSD